ncbi:hypothetical protein ROBYS_45460 [Roseobacter sp. OBYS 0001]|nr:hypothetical protein ROBYS_45460 [Roseobacter sp. OBYS 0001]
MGHVTGQGDKGGIAMFCIDRRDSGPQARGGVLAIEFPFANDMGVGKMNKFHSAATGLAQSSHLVPALKIGPSQVKGIS